MRRLTTLVLPALTAVFLGGSAPAQSAETVDALERWQADPTTVFAGSEIDLDDFLYIARPVVVFANSPSDQTFIEQMEYLTDRPDALADRDVLIVTDTDPEGRSDVRLKLRPRGFMLALIGKDGRVVQRKPLPWDVRELTRSIDKMPTRQQELRDRPIGGG